MTSCWPVGRSRQFMATLRLPIWCFGVERPNTAFFDHLDRHGGFYYEVTCLICHGVMHGPHPFFSAGLATATNMMATRTVP